MNEILKYSNIPIVNYFTHAKTVVSGAVSLATTIWRTPLVAGSKDLLKRGYQIFKARSLRLEVQSKSQVSDAYPEATKQKQILKIERWAVLLFLSETVGELSPYVPFRGLRLAGKVATVAGSLLLYYSAYLSKPEGQTQDLTAWQKHRHVFHMTQAALTALAGVGPALLLLEEAGMIEIPRYALQTFSTSYYAATVLAVVGGAAALYESKEMIRSLASRCWESLTIVAQIDLSDIPAG